MQHGYTWVWVCHSHFGRDEYLDFAAYPRWVSPACKSSVNLTSRPGMLSINAGGSLDLEGNFPKTFWLTYVTEQIRGYSLFIAAG